MFNLSPIDVPDLSGRTAFVTGAGRGLGASIVEALARHGARVFAGVFDKSEDGPSRLSSVTTLTLDVTDETSAHAAVEAVRIDAGRLDVLINNAGLIAPIGPIDSLDSAALRPAFEVNTIGLHRMTCAALPLLREAGGVIINAGTGAATQPMEGWAAYCSSKAAARMMTQLFALELDGSGVKLFFLGIPPTDTPMQAEIRDAGLNPISRIPQADLVSPKVSASVVAWLCGPEARGLEDVLLDVRDERFKRMMTAG